MKRSSPHCFIHVNTSEPGQGIVQLRNKLVPVILRHTHEGTTHYNEFNFIYAMSQTLQLFHSPSGLFVWVVSSTNRAHRSGFISGVGLRTVFKVGIRSTWAVDADVSCHCNVWTSMWFAHHSDDCNLHQIYLESFFQFKGQY